jgi:hypothetical protein
MAKAVVQLAAVAAAPGIVFIVRLPVLCLLELMLEHQFRPLAFTHLDLI